MKTFFIKEKDNSLNSNEYNNNYENLTTEKKKEIMMI